MGPQAIRKVPPGMLARDMEPGPSRGIFQDLVGKIIGVTLACYHREPSLLGLDPCALTDAISDPPCGSPTRRESPNTVHGSEDKGLVGLRIHRDRDVHDFQNWRNDGLHALPQPIFDLRAELLGLSFRPGHDDGRDPPGHRGLAVEQRSPAVLPAPSVSRNGRAMAPTLTLLGLESTCDETAAAVVRSGVPDERILSSVIFDQADLHAEFGGVVPELAARAHAERIDIVARHALSQAGLTLSDMDAVAVSAGPGLIGGVLAGVMCAKGIAAGSGLPLVGVNHLGGHALTPRLTDDLPFPYLMLLVSGGHCQFLIVQGPDRFERLGGTIDDAPGEAFDKTARLLSLPQPGGPSVERAAQTGDPVRFALPRPLLDRDGCDMSFSGLKTALLRARDGCVAEHGGLRRVDQADLAAGFQRAVTDVLVEKARRALAVYLETQPETPAFAVAGGVAANSVIRAGLSALAEGYDTRFVAPPLRLCTDNAAMIAWAGLELFQRGHRDGFDLVARPRWPLDQSKPALVGSGKKGAKA